MTDLSSLFRIENIDNGYQWSIAVSNTNHYVCRIWQDSVTNKEFVRNLYVGAYGKVLQDVIEECFTKFKEKRKAKP